MLHYTIYKNNDTSLPWLTFIHGAGGSSSIWHKQIRFFSKFFNLLLIDLAINRATMTKFGIKVAELTVMFVKD